MKFIMIWIYLGRVYLYRVGFEFILKKKIFYAGWRGEV